MALTNNDTQESNLPENNYSVQYDSNENKTSKVVQIEQEQKISFKENFTESDDSSVKSIKKLKKLKIIRKLGYSIFVRILIILLQTHSIYRLYCLYQTKYVYFLFIFILIILIDGIFILIKNKVKICFSLF